MGDWSATHTVRAVIVRAYAIPEQLATNGCTTAAAGRAMELSQHRWSRAWLGNVCSRCCAVLQMHLTPQGKRASVQGKCMQCVASSLLAMFHIMRHAGLELVEGWHAAAAAGDKQVQRSVD